MVEESNSLESARRELARELLRERNRQKPLAVFFAVFVLAFGPLVQLSFASASVLGPEDFGTKLARLQNVALTEEFREDFLSVHDVICDREGSPKARMLTFYSNQFAAVNPAVVAGGTLLLHLSPEGTISYRSMGMMFYRSLPFRPDFPFGHCLDYSIFS